MYDRNVVETFVRRSLVLLALALASLSFGLGVGDKAPPLKFETLVRGTTVDLDKGIHVVEFWATWSPESKEATPKLAALAKRFKGKADFTAIAVAERGDDPLAGVKKYALDQGEGFVENVAWDGEKGEAAQAWMVAARQRLLPTAFLVKDGTILWVGRPAEGLDKALEQTAKGTFDLAASKESFDAEMKTLDEDEAKAKAEELAILELLKPMIEAMQNRDAPAALKAIDEAEAKRPDLKSRLETTRFSIYLGTRDPRLSELAKRFVEEDFKDDAITLNTLAWSIVDPQNEDPEPNNAVALLLAKRAAETSKMEDGQILDTFALALWKTGDRKTALEIQTKAVALVEKDPEITPESKKEIADRLEMFKKGATERPPTGLSALYLPKGTVFGV